MTEHEIDTELQVRFALLSVRMTVTYRATEGSMYSLLVSADAYSSRRKEWVELSNPMIALIYNAHWKMIEGECWKNEDGREEYWKEEYGRRRVREEICLRSRELVGC